MSDLEPKDSANRRTLVTFQIHLLITSLFSTGAFAAVIAVAVFVPLAAQLGRAELDSEGIVGLADHFLFLHAALWPVIGLAFVSCVVSSTILYQRMRSPLVRFMRVFENVERNEPVEPIRIRKLDYLAEEERALNRMIVAFARRRKAEITLLEKMRWELDALSASRAGEAVDLEAEDRALDRLATIVKELENNGPEARDEER